MRAFYRIKRTDWPPMVDGERSKADTVAVGGTQALLIVHSAIYPNPVIEALTGSKFLAHTYAELANNGLATATQVAKVFITEYLDGIDENGDPAIKREKVADVPVGATIRREHVIPHSWGASEGKIEQSDVDSLG